MRILGQGLKWGLVATVGLWVYQHTPPLPEPVSTSQNHAAHDDRLNRTRSAIVYQLDPHEWLSFDISSSGDLLFRLISNAETPAGVDDETAPWQYSLEYQLLSSANTILLEQEYHFRTRRTLYKNTEAADRPADASEEPALFYLGGPLQPTDSRAIQLLFHNHPNAARLRVRLKQLDAPLQGVVLRLYQRESIPEYKRTHGWARLNDRKKKVLARGNVYEHEWLTKAEQQQLLATQWNPMAPIGVTGHEAYRRNLYVLREKEGERVIDPVIPEGLLVRPVQNGIIAIPPGGGSLTLHITDLEQELGDKSPSESLLRWISDNDDEEEMVVTLDQPISTFQHDFKDSGLLEIISTRTLVLNARITTADGSDNDITPENIFLAAYSVAADQWLEFSIQHLSSFATPLRIDARSLQASDTPAKMSLSYRLLDDAGKLLADGQCQAEVSLSRYDSLLEQTDSPSTVSDPLRCYIRPSQAVARIQLSLNGAGLLTAYNRPADLIAETRVPEDYISYDPRRQRLPSWFRIRAKQHDQLQREARLKNLAIQKRPRQRDAEIQAGRYLWEDFQPQGDWVARHLLNPRDSRLPVREHSLSSIYREVPSDRTVTLDFAASDGLQMTHPSLIFTRQQASPEQIEIRVDGKLVMNPRIRGLRGEIPLPPMRSGTHKISIQAGQQSHWFISSTRGEGATYIKRLANRIGQQKLHFVYTKALVNEVLTGHFQVPAGSTQTRSLRLSLRARQRQLGNSSGEWTLTERRFLIAPDNSHSAIVLNSRRDRVDIGRRFFVPLQSDLPAGEYDVTIWLEDDGPEAYLSLYRLIPGLHQRQQLYRQQDFSTVAPET